MQRKFWSVTFDPQVLLMCDIHYYYIKNILPYLWFFFSPQCPKISISVSFRVTQVKSWLGVSSDNSIQVQIRHFSMISKGCGNKTTKDSL